VRLFYEIAALSFRRHLTYRSAAMAGLATNFFFGLLRAAVLVALYGGRAEVEGMTVQDAITYTGLTQAVIAYLSLFAWYPVMESIHSGDISADLLKPMRLMALWLAHDVGRAVVALLLRGITIMAIYAVVFDITVPEPSRWPALVLVSVLALLVSFLWRFLVNLTAFWSPNAQGIGRFAFALSWFMSGFLMPLRFFPDWVVDICYLTPFPYTVNTIVEVYLGLASGTQLALEISLQVFWAVALVVVCQLVLHAGVRRLVILGG
jgi:ABC-2 type transport system permease protein